MLDLKQLGNEALNNQHCIKNHNQFRTAGFDPEELLQLKDMNNKELTGLMIYCGIHVYNGVPLIVMKDDEMRMAYLIWRGQRVDEKKNELQTVLERRLKWLRYGLEVVKGLAND